MIRIRTGGSWRYDPRVDAVRRAAPRARAAAARGLVDALALEVDGVDIAAGRAEGPLLPSLEALLRAIARVVAGAPHATVPFPDGEIELVIRRRGGLGLLTVVALTRPTRVLARDVEVDVEALAAAALEASAAFVRELAEVLPDGAAHEARRLRAAARALRRTEAVAPRRAARPRARASPAGPSATTPLRCILEISDDDALLAAYEGGRPDLGSLLAPGRIALRTADGHEAFTIDGLPFLALRDLGAGADALVAAARRRDARIELPLPRPGRGAAPVLSVDLAAGRVAFPGGASFACSAPDLARAFSEAAAEFARLARARNPRQAENAYLAELEASAAERIAQAAELAAGDLAAASPAPVRTPAAPRVALEPLGPGRLRRLAFRRVWSVDVGPPAGEGLLRAGGRAVVAGAAALVAVDRASGAIAWRAGGCTFAAALPGAVVVAREGTLSAVSSRTGRVIWTRGAQDAVPSGAVALARGPYLVVDAGTVTAVDPASGRTLWRFQPPGAARVGAAPFGGVAAVGADTSFVYGVDAAGRVIWRVRAPGPIVRAPTAAAGLCLALAAADPGTALLALDPATGARRWEARLDLAPSGPPIAWGGRIAVAGALGGDPIVAAVERGGAVAWTAAPALSGTASIASAGALLAVRDSAGALVALGRDGQARWSRAARPEHAPAGRAAPAVARGTVFTPAGDGVAAIDAATGDLVGALPGAAPDRLWVDASLVIAAIDADGLAAGWRLATHLSVV